MQPPIPPRSRDRVAGLRLPELPPRDLERLAAGPHSAPALSTAPDSASYLPPPSSTPTKFGGEGSPADVRGYAPAITPLLMRGGVVSPGVGGGSGLVLPTLSLPISGPPLPPASHLPPVSLALAAPPPLLSPPVPTLPSTSAPSGSISSPGAPSSSPLASTPSPTVLSVPIGTPGGTRRTPAPATLRSSTPLPVSTSKSGARTTPSSPVPCGMTQNEIKKLQNRKSAKRFREAQKQRWKNMADDLMSHKRTIDELRAKLAAQASSESLRPAHSGGVGVDGKRSVVSINDLVDDEAVQSSAPVSNSHAEAESALYAQILSNRSNVKTEDNPGTMSDSGIGEPFAKELGLLTWCAVVDKASTRIVSVRRGSSHIAGSQATERLNDEEQSEFGKALRCGKPVKLTYTRDGNAVNAVMNPVEGSDRVVVAEFSPF